MDNKGIISMDNKIKFLNERKNITLLEDYKLQAFLMIVQSCRNSQRHPSTHTHTHTYTHTNLSKTPHVAVIYIAVPQKNIRWLVFFLIGSFYELRAKNI